MKALLVIFALLLLAAPLPCHAATDAIPQRAAAHRADLVRAAHYYWGLDAPVATFAAQVHQESLFKPEAVSPVGARGMAQFMPTTASWIAGAYTHLKDNEPHNPVWALRALVTYDRYLWDRVKGANDCQRMAKTLSAYNGGLGWVQRDEKLAASKGLDPLTWFNSVETVNAGRKLSSKRENQAYPRRILWDLSPLYEAENWGLGVRCE